MTLTLTLFSDFVWPFCYIAERSSLVRLEKEFDIQVVWRGFELHPETPPGGVDLSKVHAGGGSGGMTQYLERFAESFGVRGMKFGKRMPKTAKALQISEYARDRGALDVFRNGVMDAHWLGARNIEDDTVLGEIASASGLDPTSALQSVNDPQYLMRVEENRRAYKVAGTGGIPTFVVGASATEGCQPYQALHEFARAAGAQPRA